MLRGNHSIILLAISVTIAAVQQSVYADITSTIAAALTTTTTPVLDNTQESQRLEQHHNQQDQLHPSLLVDTKYWIRNTEFGERDNWRDKIKPCTLLEKIQFNEQAFISMGDSLDSLAGTLESNLKELTLSMTGILLLEEDTLNDQVDSMFFQYLNQSGDCFDSESSNHNNLGDKKKEKEKENIYNERVFKFEPESDHMSWFNPENWRSELNEEEINDWIPDSHLIPCSEDIVVFGSRHTALNQMIEANERAKTMSFKVNFRPSQAAAEAATTTASGPSKVAFSSADELLVDYADSKVDSLQVSKLLIGNTEYNQRQFQQLISSKQYENILFQFNDSKSALKANGGGEFEYSTHSPLTLDESSVHSYFDYNICSDEAGCLCGNENVNIMKTTCSFTYKLQPSEQPCLDPITSSGYCSKICATVLIINMDPIKFKEKLLISALNTVFADNEQSNFAENVLAAPRRTSNNKYEITFRHVPSDTIDYEATLGIEHEFAQLVYQKLNNGKLNKFESSSI